MSSAPYSCNAHEFLLKQKNCIKRKIEKENRRERVRETYNVIGENLVVEMEVAGGDIIMSLERIISECIGTGEGGNRCYNDLVRGKKLWRWREIIKVRDILIN